MDRVEARGLSTALRVLLCSLGVAGGLVLLGLAFGALSASADEPDSTPPATTSAPPTLLGAVGSAVGAVTAPVEGTVTTLTTTVSSVVAPVTQALPAPVQQVVQPVTQAVTTVVQSVSVTQTLAPVTGAVDNVAGSLPIVGPTLSSTVGPVSAVTTPVTSTVDSVVGSVGQTTGTVFGPPPAGSQSTPPSGADQQAGAPSDAATVAATIGPDAPADGPTASSWSLRLIDLSPTAGTTASARAGALGSWQETSAPAGDSQQGGTAPSAGSSSTGSGSAGGSGGAGSAGTVPAAPDFASPSVSLAGAAGDDDLPTTPTYETDSTPD